MQVNLDWAKQPHGITKIVLLLLTITSLALLFKYGIYGYNEDGGRLVFCVVISNAFVSFYFVLGKIVDSSAKLYLTVLVFDSAHALLSLVVAGIGLSHKQWADGSTVCLVFILLSAVAMLIDAFLEYKHKN